MLIQHRKNQDLHSPVPSLMSDSQNYISTEGDTPSAHLSHFEESFSVQCFPYYKGKPSISYINALRYESLAHPNISKFILKEQKKVIKDHSGDSTEISVIFYESAFCRLEQLYTLTKNDEKLARTLFLQVLSAVDFCHQKGISHMNIKPENIHLGFDYNLKLGDFSSAYKKGDFYLQGSGTQNFRAPELRDGTCHDTEKADIYSLGLVLFCFYFGEAAYDEDVESGHTDYMSLMLEDPETFWKSILKNRLLKGSKEFESLVEAMVSKNPQKRISLAGIKMHPWCLESKYSDEELKERFEYNLVTSLIGNLN